MPELISTTLLPLLAGAAVKALITGQPPDPGDWAAATTSILQALLDREDEVTEALDRIEHKVDELSQLSFRQAFGAGRYNLNQARTARREDERLRNLDKARDKFVDALQVTYTQAEPQLAQAIVHWHLGMVYLLMGSAAESRQALVDARDEAARAVLARVADWEGSAADHQNLALQRRPRGLAHRLGQPPTATQLEDARHAFIDARARNCQQYVEFQTALEEVRRQLGEPAGACLALTVRTPAAPWRYEEPPEASVQLIVGRNDVFHTAIHMHGAVVGKTGDVPFIRGYLVQEYVDVDLELEFAPGAGSVDCVADIEYLRPAPQLPPLPEPGFPTRSPSPLVLVGQAGESVRGWVRLASERGRWPRTFELHLWPFGPNSGRVCAVAGIGEIADTTAL